MAERAAEKDAPSACLTCEHRAIWHHDERGCQYNGNGPFRCTCRRTSDQVVARIVADAVNASHRLGDDDTRVTPPEVGDNG